MGLLRVQGGEGVGHGGCLGLEGGEGGVVLGYLVLEDGCEGLREMVEEGFFFGVARDGGRGEGVGCCWEGDVEGGVEEIGRWWFVSDESRMGNRS